MTVLTAEEKSEVEKCGGIHVNISGLARQDEDGVWRLNGLDVPQHLIDNAIEAWRERIKAMDGIKT